MRSAFQKCLLPNVSVHMVMIFHGECTEPHIFHCNSFYLEISFKSIRLPLAFFFSPFYFLPILFYRNVDCMCRIYLCNVQWNVHGERMIKAKNTVKFNFQQGARFYRYARKLFCWHLRMESKYSSNPRIYRSY